MRLEQINSQPPSIISQQQRDSYYDQGYLYFPQMLGNDWLKPIRSALGEIIESSRAYTQSTQKVDIEPDHSAQNPRLRRVAYLDEFDPIFWQLCTDSVIPDIAADLLGPNIRFRELMINFKWAHGGAEVKWHQDLVFYPHTNAGTLQFLLLLDGATPDQGPLQVIPGSHKGEIFAHYDAQRKWTGAISQRDLASVAVDQAVSLTGAPGTLSVHHSRTIHGSAANQSRTSRPAFVITYSAADAIPYTAPAYRSVNYHTLVRGTQPLYAHHENMIVPLPPDWSEGYTSIFDHQHKQQQ